MKLLEIETDDEFNYLGKLLHEDKSYYLKYYIHIGGVKRSNKWFWESSNKTVDSEGKWMPGEPNNKYSNENCLSIWIWRELESIGYNDGSCTTDPWQYICKKTTPLSEVDHSDCQMLSMDARFDPNL